MTSIDIFTGDLHWEAYSDMASFTEGPDLGDPSSIHVGDRRFLEVCSVVRESVLSSVAHLLWLANRVIESMSRTSIPEVSVSAQIQRYHLTVHNLECYTDTLRWRA